jgi:16S rRNA A1518/A1519 N6-dimethyltransferase RsmA/KsgA/DIM1 with predicted DNA glycosylase/AP lyase activity
MMQMDSGPDLSPAGGLGRSARRPEPRVHDQSALLADCLAEQVTPGDSVLKIGADQPKLVVALAARAGWLTVVEPDGGVRAALFETLMVSGSPNVSIVASDADGAALGPHDVAVDAAGVLTRSSGH